MRVLGISGGHDSNWCVVEDGRLLGAFEKERFSRKKHDTGDVRPYLEPTLGYLGVTLADVDVLATSEAVWEDTGPGTRLVEGERYTRPDQWTWQTVELLGRTFRCVAVPHHLAHAAYAFYTSGFPEACVLTWDAGGEEGNPGAFATTTISCWEAHRLKWLLSVPEADFGSIWSAYSAAIFGSGFAAGKLMGLAALGSDRVVDAMASRYLTDLDGIMAGTVAMRLSAEEQARPAFAVGRDWTRRENQDAAFAVQELTLRAGLGIARAARELTRSSCLALSGGVALNGYLCTALKRESGFERVFVPPAVNDGGIAVGCALFALHHVLEVPPPGDCGPIDRVGLSYTHDECASAVADAGLEGRRVERDEAVEAAAAAISEGRIVAWYEGRSEHGPRALGSRSILCAGSDVDLRDRLNAEVKFREHFRPVAPVVRAGDAATYFDLDWDSPYMMYIVAGTPATAAGAPGVLHVDGTARVQTVGAESSLGRIAARVGELTGTPLIVNTSLNVQEPIVETPAEAVAAFVRVPIDLLVLEDLLVARP